MSPKDSSRRGESAAAPIPDHPTLATLRAAAADCHACDLFRNATQTVFGEAGDADVEPLLPRLMLVGEQPGDVEDRAGRPFVGPAGRLLDKLLLAAGIDRRRVYLTNVVKHFKWEPQKSPANVPGGDGSARPPGKRRIHAKPNAHEIAACRPWLDAEIRLVRPTVIVCLGATAAQALLGKQFRVTRERGHFIPSPLAPYVLATIHPSALLRAPDAETRHREEALFLDDLKQVAALL